MVFSFSGDKREAPVIETIYIPQTDRVLTLTVLAYGTGAGVVLYSWDGIDPCPQEFAGCEPCETYVGNLNRNDLLLFHRILQKLLAREKKNLSFQNRE